jgi:hypothetical protein
MEVGSFLICRVVLLSPAPRQTPVFLVLRSGGQVFASLPCDDHGTFCEQFVFEGAVEDVSVELVLRRRWPFPDKRLEKGTFGVRALEPEVVCPLAVALGSMSLQMLLLRTTRRIEDVCKESDAVVEEDDFVVLPSLLLQEPKADVVAVVPEDPTIKSMSSFLGDLDLKCFVCKEECSKLWRKFLFCFCLFFVFVLFCFCFNNFQQLIACTFIVRNACEIWRLKNAHVPVESVSRFQSGL